MSKKGIIRSTESTDGYYVTIPSINSSDKKSTESTDRQNGEFAVSIDAVDSIHSNLILQSIQTHDSRSRFKMRSTESTQSICRSLTNQSIHYFGRYQLNRESTQSISRSNAVDQFKLKRFIL
jgi:hypothetical protein